ncbi:DNA sulfur modification protein DndB [Paenibacillus sp. RC343]|uniref:DNA sulfur modification protein DndB n=1 Tax=Paenibacillus sp. RC343 TaxID=3045841 RepID=UPI0024B99414|nr:DNA sulfur modification protein DndB [Paenibacillus sp. RC343]
MDDKRVEGIKQYILNDISGTFFPPAILNSRATLSFEKTGFLSVRNGNFTVIDGQHRIKAIITLLDEIKGPLSDELKLMELPIVIIENLENYQHRDLFYMINETPKNVESNVSERFAPKLENLLGLDFFSKHKHLIDSIEWHEKQSKEKIVYLHMTDCIRELTRILYPNLRDWYDCERDLLYKESTYTDIITHYWNKYFEILSQLKSKAFFRKKITIRAIIEDVYNKIDYIFNVQAFNPRTLEESIRKIKQLIDESMETLLCDPLIEYHGSESVRKDVFSSIRHFLTINNKLIKYKDYINKNSKIKSIIVKVLEPYYVDNILLLDSSDYLLLDSTLQDIFNNTEHINEIEAEAIKSLMINKQTTVNEIFESSVKG